MPNYFHEHSIADVGREPSLTLHKMAYSLLASPRQTSFSNSYPKSDHSSDAYGDDGKATVANWIGIANATVH